MARFTELRMTNQGRTALVESIATSVPLIIGADDPGIIQLGDGFMPPGATRETMTALVNPTINAIITSRQFNDDGTATISAAVNNADITQEMRIREIGIPAKFPDGTPLLFGYDNAGDGAGILPSGGGSAFVSHIFNVKIVVGNAANVIINYGDAARLQQIVDTYITTEGQQDFEPESVDPRGAVQVVVEGAIVFGWTIVSGNIRLSAPLPAGLTVRIFEVRGGGVSA